MNRFFIVLFFVFSFFGCKPGVPEYVIQPDKMEKVLYDFHIVDAYLGTLPNVDTAKLEAAKYYSGIYKKFQIDSALYNVSLSYYYKNPERFNALLAKVVVKLDEVKKINDLRELSESKLAQDKLVLKNNSYLKVNLDSTKLKFKLDSNPFNYIRSAEE